MFSQNNIFVIKLTNKEIILNLLIGRIISINIIVDKMFNFDILLNCIDHLL